MTRVDLKIVLLGRQFSGKTCLVEQFLYGQFGGENAYQNTIGAAFGAKKVEINGQMITLGLWDTAGGERYESIGRIYYRQAHAAIVCFDLTEADSFEKAKFWVSQLLQCEEKCKIYLCGTKKDLIIKPTRPRAIDYHNVTDYADDINAELFETSSKTGENVSELFLKIGENYLKEQIVDDTGTGFNIMSVEKKKNESCLKCGY